MRSMTGYGAAEGRVGKGKLFIELKSVNHRFCDINLKLPPKMSALEPLIRRYLQQRFVRGKIEVFIKEKEQLFGGMKLTVDLELAKQYQKNFQKLSKSLGITKDVNFLQYIGMDKFVNLEEKEGSYTKLWMQVEKLLKEASNHVLLMQNREGSHLLDDQKKCVDKLLKTVRRMHKEIERVMSQQEKRLRRRLAGSQQGALDDQRLQMEVAYLGNRQDISEELTRLDSHIKQYNVLMKSKESVGRKLDFLLQEMNREVNTIGSKAADVAISRLVVDSKALLERLREQIQNVE